MDNAPSAVKTPPKKKPSGKPKLVRRSPQRPPLRLTPYAWAKLLFLRDVGPVEIGGFGISSQSDPLLVRDVRLVAQKCDWANVVLDDAAVADFFDEQVDLGRSPEEFGRIWVHTHPGDSPRPSQTDEETFARVFGGCDWAVMFILAQGGQNYARLQFGVGPGGCLELPVEVAFDEPFPASDLPVWEDEYASCIQAVDESAPAQSGSHDDRWWDRYRMDERLLDEEVLDAPF